MTDVPPEPIGRVPAAQPDTQPATDPPAAGPAAASSGLAPPVEPDEIGRLGRYRVLGVLGQGGMGIVYRAEDPQLRRHVALKVMRPALAADPHARQRFLREARAAAAIEHDHILPIYQVDEDGGVPYLAMPVLRGVSLQTLLAGGRRQPLAEVLRIGRETAAGLAAAHDSGLIHRDIKPGNIWLEPSGRVKILDFGLARPVAEVDLPPPTVAAGPESGATRLTRTGAVMGTPGYAAPEQLDGGTIDGRCDLFALGCVLYVLCTGRPAFQGGDTVSTFLAPATSSPVPPHVVEPTVPRSLSGLIMRLLSSDPAGRPPSAMAVIAELDAVARERPRRPVGRVLLSAGAGLALLLGVALVLSWGRLPWSKGDPATPGPGRPPIVAVEPIEVDPTPRVAVWFHDKPTKDEAANRLLPPPTMRFGITTNEPPPAKLKKLTFNVLGLTNNTCLKINGKEVLFGNRAEGRFEGKPDGKAARWRPNDTDLVVTQKVEVVPGQVRRRAGKLVQLTDTVLVRYEIRNDGAAREVGLRVLLDTYIGSKDGVPFYVSGEAKGITTRRDYRGARVPNYVFALEKNDLKDPGTVCRVALNYPKLEKPDRLVLCAWPKLSLKYVQDATPEQLAEKADGHNTRWEAPLFDIDTIKDAKGNGDSAVWVYWQPKILNKGQTRTVGFAYGLADIMGDEAEGVLAVVSPTAAQPGVPFTIQALVNNPQAGQTLALELPSDLRLVAGEARQAVPELGPRDSRQQAVLTWRVVGDRVGTYLFAVHSAGLTQSRRVTILRRDVWAD